MDHQNDNTKEISLSNFSKDELKQYVERFVENETQRPSNKTIIILISIQFIIIYSLIIFVHIILEIYYFIPMLDYPLIIPIITTIIIYKFWKFIEDAHEKALIKIIEYEKQNNVKLIPADIRKKLNIPDK